MSFSFTSLLAIVFRGDAVSTSWALAIGVCLCSFIFLSFKNQLVQLQEKLFKNLFLEFSSGFNWIVALSIGVGVTMAILYTHLTGIGFSLLLGVLSAVAVFLFIVILLYGSNDS